MSAYPKIIFLFPMENQIVWDADKGSPEAEGAQEYVRADTLPQPVLPPYPPEGEGMPRYGLQWNGPESPVTVLMDDGYWTPWHLANSEVERLQARVDEKCDAPVGWIAPDKYRAACESKMEFFKTIKELRKQNEKLKERVAEIIQAGEKVCEEAGWLASENDKEIIEAFKAWDLVGGPDDGGSDA